VGKSDDFINDNVK